MTDALVELRRYIDPEIPVEWLRDMATASWLLSEALYAGSEDVVPAPGDDLVAPTRAAILGTLLMEPLVLGLLRTALAMRSVHLSAGEPLPGPKLADLGSGG